MSGIKQAAKALSASTNISHSKAIEIIAQALGHKDYNTFLGAKNKMTAYAPPLRPLRGMGGERILSVNDMNGIAFTSSPFVQKGIDSVDEMFGKLWSPSLFRFFYGYYHHDDGRYQYWSKSVEELAKSRLLNAIKAAYGEKCSAYLSKESISFWLNAKIVGPESDIDLLRGNSCSGAIKALVRNANRDETWLVDFALKACIHGKFKVKSSSGESLYLSALSMKERGKVVHVLYEHDGKHVYGEQDHAAVAMDVLPGSILDNADVLFSMLDSGVISHASFSDVMNLLFRIDTWQNRERRKAVTVPSDMEDTTITGTVKCCGLSYSEIDKAVSAQGADSFGEDWFCYSPLLHETPDKLTDLMLAATKPGYAPIVSFDSAGLILSGMEEILKIFLHKGQSSGLFSEVKVINSYSESFILR